MNQVIIYVIAGFAVLGALDRIFGDRLGVGKQFEEGLLSIGIMSVSLVGMIVLSPVLATLLKPVLLPIFECVGADPSMFIGCILANDMGGAPLAQAIALSEDAGNLAGLIVGSMLGGTVVFHIPVALGVIGKEDRESMAKGIMAGVMTTPIGSLIGGLVAGYSMGMLLRNLVPILMFSVLIALGLWKAQKAMVKGFIWFGKGVTVVITFGAGLGILEALTGITLIPGTNSIYEGFKVAADCAIVLAGAFPMIYLLTKMGRKPLLKLGKLLGINEVATAGMLATLAASISVFGMVKDMDRRGKVINMAFVVSASSVFGDHLGFTAGFNQDMIVPVMVGKLVGGITAVFAALFITKKEV